MEKTFLCQQHNCHGYSRLKNTCWIYVSKERHYPAVSVYFMNWSSLYQKTKIKRHQNIFLDFYWKGIMDVDFVNRLFFKDFWTTWQRFFMNWWVFFVKIEKNYITMVRNIGKLENGPKCKNYAFLTLCVVFFLQPWKSLLIFPAFVSPISLQFEFPYQSLSVELCNHAENTQNHAAILLKIPFGGYLPSRKPRNNFFFFSVFINTITCTKTWWPNLKKLSNSIK